VDDRYSLFEVGRICCRHLILFWVTTVPGASKRLIPRSGLVPMRERRWSTEGSRLEASSPEPARRKKTWRYGGSVGELWLVETTMVK